MNTTFPTPAEMWQEVLALRKEISALRSKRGLKVFALNSSADFGKRVAEALEVPLAKHEEKCQKDGERYFRSLENVRRSSVFLICSMYGNARQSVNDNLAMISIAAGCLKTASAGEVTLVSPLTAYSRLDRKVNSREPIGTQIIAQQIEAIGVDRIITMDVHNLSAFQNAYRTCRTDNLECCLLLADHMANELNGIDPKDIAILSPDSGGMGRAKFFRKAIARRLGQGVGIAFLDKERSGDEVRSHHIVGDLRPVMIAIDDMINSGSTIREFARASYDRGAKRIYAVATHGLFVGNANENLSVPYLNKIVVSDTVEPFRLNEEIRSKVEIVSTAQLFAEAIRRTYTGESLSSLFNDQ